MTAAGLLRRTRLTGSTRQQSLLRERQEEKGDLIKARTLYGYSNARVKAMESFLLDGRQMEEIMKAKDTGAIISLLYQTDYRQDLEEFGGMSIKEELIDFALSKNLARRLGKLVDISPTTDRKLMRSIVGKWDLSNIRLAIEAKGRRASYDSISKYVVDEGRYNRQVIKEAMSEESVEALLSKLMINSPYADILRSAADEYKKRRMAIDAVNVIDIGYYSKLGSTISKLRTVHPQSSRMLKISIDVRNLMLLIKAKRAGIKFTEMEPMIAEHGTIAKGELSKMYESSKDLESFVESIKIADMQNALDIYKKSRNKELLSFEIALRSSMLKDSVRLLGHSVLSFGSILAYLYFKEIEVDTVRVIIHGSMYGLSNEEKERLMVWRKN
ncbi:MAG: V-type ATPase subunit [Candidatus Marsarchaeota archaeon]|nr:V-type ATPase subunit [Candidatus Marsarchaeota archaeon]